MVGVSPAKRQPRVPAYLVVPAGRGPFAAILFGHWMMKGSPFCNRREFLDEAVVLAHSGAISLLIDAPLVRPGYVEEKDELREEAGWLVKRLSLKPVDQAALTRVPALQ